MLDDAHGIGRELRECDATCEPDIYFDERGAPEKDNGAEALSRYLTLLHNESSCIKSFSVLGYAALWHLNHRCLNGATQREVSSILGVKPEVFNRAVKHWALVIGTPSEKMRLRDGSAQAFIKGQRRDGLNPMNPFARLDSLRARKTRGSWQRWQLTLPLNTQ